jgi:hypothetical protein
MGELRMIKRSFRFRQFFDFRFSVSASRFFNLPHPIQTLHNPRDPRCPSRNLLLPLNMRFFAGCPDGGRLTKGEIKYGKLDNENCIQPPLPFWSLSEAGSGRVSIRAEALT